MKKTSEELSWEASIQLDTKWGAVLCHSPCQPLLFPLQPHIKVGVLLALGFIVLCCFLPRPLHSHIFSVLLLWPWVFATELLVKSYRSSEQGSEQWSDLSKVTQTPSTKPGAESRCPCDLVLLQLGRTANLERVYFPGLICLFTFGLCKPLHCFTI